MNYIWLLLIPILVSTIAMHIYVSGQEFERAKNNQFILFDYIKASRKALGKIGVWFWVWLISVLTLFAWFIVAAAILTQ